MFPASPRNESSEEAPHADSSGRKPQGKGVHEEEDFLGGSSLKPDIQTWLLPLRALGLALPESQGLRLPLHHTQGHLLLSMWTSDCPSESWACVLDPGHPVWPEEICLGFSAFLVAETCLHL